MTTKEKYDEAFCNGLNIAKEKVTQDLKYQGIPEWDSVGHMSLVAELEDSFDISFETDDIIDFSSYQKGKEILKKYGVEV